WSAPPRWTRRWCGCGGPSSGPTRGCRRGPAGWGGGRGGRGRRANRGGPPPRAAPAGRGARGRPAAPPPRAGLGAPELRGLLGRRAAACQARSPEVAALARDLVFRYFDEPVLERALATVHAEMAGYLDALEADPDRADRAELVRRLVECPQPMRST